MIGQRMLKCLTRTTGVGLHTGKKVAMTLRRAPPDSESLFKRTDLPQSRIRARRVIRIKKLLRVLLSEADAWETVVFESYADAPLAYIEAPALRSGGPG